MTPTLFDTQPCGCLGCRDDAVCVIDHPEYGQRVVCDGHAGDHPVIGTVVDGDVEVAVK